MKTLTVKATLLEEALGMTPGNEEAFNSFLAFRKAKMNLKKAVIDPNKEKEEIEAFKFTIESMKLENLEKGVDIFLKDPATGNFMLFDYQLRGFFKDSMKALKECLKGENLDKASVDEKFFKCLTDFKKQPNSWVDKGVFIGPRKAQFILPEGGETGWCQRSLRVEKFPQDQTSLKCSQTIPAGTVIRFKIGILNNSYESLVLCCLHYGFLRGLCEWRNSGKGKFTFELYDDEKKAWVYQKPKFDSIFKFEEKIPD